MGSSWGVGCQRSEPRARWKKKRNIKNVRSERKGRKTTSPAPGFGERGGFLRCGSFGNRRDGKGRSGSNLKNAPATIAGAGENLWQDRFIKGRKRKEEEDAARRACDMRGWEFRQTAAGDRKKKKRD